jgi:hypothetical protein
MQKNVDLFDVLSVAKRIAAVGMALQRHFEEFLAKREPPKTFCPSEVARAMCRDELDEMGFSEWRDAMPRIRELAWSFRDSGKCEILQKGVSIGENAQQEDVSGPIRIRRQG